MSAAASEAEVLGTAAALVAAFGAHATDDYFSFFDPDASFVFYTADRRLDSRAEYQALWRSWEQDSGFHVERCVSTSQRVDVIGEVGIFSHYVETDVTMDGATDTVLERETIVFARRADRWVAVHEHLSPRAMEENTHDA